MVEGVRHVHHLEAALACSCTWMAHKRSLLARLIDDHGHLKLIMWRAI